MLSARAYVLEAWTAFMGIFAGPRLYNMMSYDWVYFVDSPVLLVY